MGTFDVAVIGAGPGGYVAAIRAAQRGATVCLIEREALGGTCLNWGCIPTKTMVHSSTLLSRTWHAAELGLTGDAFSVDWPALQARKRKVVGTLQKGIAALLKANNVTVIEGTGCLKSRREVAVSHAESEQTVEAGTIIIATGSETARPQAFPFDGTRVVGSRELLDIVALPASILIVGGGVIGCEFASMLNAFDVDVSIVEMLDRLLPLEDEDVSKAIAREFKKAKITVHTGAAIEDVQATGNGVQAMLNGEKLEADMMLVAVGRALNTASIGLGSVGVKTEQGAIVVDEHMRTSVANIYAIGDITAKQQLAHVASAQALVAADNATGGDETMDYTVVPNCIFTAPEIASVGMSEAQAREAAGEIRIGMFPYAALGKALAIGETTGFYKIVADAGTDAILGVQIVGAHATDLIAEAALAIRLECTVAELARTIHAHPTLAEGLMEAAHAVHGEAVHVPPRRR
jgi:dihydrolipoamide dehydrogenase